MPHFTPALAFTYVALLATTIDAAPLRRFDMAKKGSALRVVKRDSEDTLSPLNRLLKSLSLTNANSTDTESLSADIERVVQLVMGSANNQTASPTASTSASGVSNVDIPAMQDAYADEIVGLADASAEPSTSQEATVDISAMQDAYKQGIAGLNDSKQKRSLKGSARLRERANRIKRAAAESSAAPVLINVNDTLIDIKDFPEITVTEVLVPTPAVDSSWSAPSGSVESSVQHNYTRVAYQLAQSSASASGSMASGSAPVALSASAVSGSAPVAFSASAASGSAPVAFSASAASGSAPVALSASAASGSAPVALSASAASGSAPVAFSASAASGSAPVALSASMASGSAPSKVGAYGSAVQQATPRETLDSASSSSVRPTSSRALTRSRARSSTKASHSPAATTMVGKYLPIQHGW